MSRRVLALSLVLALPLTAGGVYFAWRAVQPPEKEQMITACVIEAPEEEETYEEPIIEDFETVEFEMEESVATTDSPFDAKLANSMVGIGGGAGGQFGGRFGGRAVSREQYAPIDAVSSFKDTSVDPAVTFAADVDTGAYTNARRMILREERLPPTNAVRVEEFLNYFPYEGLDPVGDDPIGANIEISSCPWAPDHRLAHVVLRTTPIPAEQRQPANLVFLLDVSGSMQSRDKLPLLKDAFRMLTEQLTGRDRVAIVVYAGAAGLVLPSTVCSQKDALMDAIDSLQAGGSTAGAAGIQLAYQLAEEHLVPGGINRVILATDGDFNVGISDRDELVRVIEEKARGGVFLTTLGFGRGNINDALLEQLADHGNGAYAYIDSEMEARKVLVEELGSTLEVAAKDVKLQLLLDAERYAAHRLIGYSNRRLSHGDFKDDTKDGGELGAGHEVTAMIELVPRGVALPAGLEVREDDSVAPAKETTAAIELRVRYKDPEGSESRLITFTGEDDGGVLATAAEDLRFAAAVAWFGEALASDEKDARAMELAADLGAGALGVDAAGYRAGFLELARAAAAIAGK